MAKFRLIKKTGNQSVATFHVINEADGSVCGSINVKPNEVASLLQHWTGSTADQRQAKSQSPVAKMSESFVASARKRKPMSKQAALRGC